jgi:hypothetical protein
MAPGGSSAEALTEIEKKLSKLPVAELPEPELLTLAEGIRDRLYRPVIQAQDRASAEDERRRQQAQRRADLIAYGVSYANSELEKEQDLDGWARLSIRENVKGTLEQELDGSESQADVRGLVDESLDDKIAEAVEDRWKSARPNLIAHGVAYAKRELAQEEGLNAWDRLIEGAVKEELKQTLTGEESDRDVADIVDDILDAELGEAQTEDEED